MQQLAITYLPIDRLKGDPKNPRHHSPKQIKQIARSIESFGFNVPVLVNAQLQVLAGHGRLEACKQLGWKEVPTIMLEHLGDAQARAFMIADNRLTANSTWNDVLLAEQLQILAASNLDFSLEVTGFTMGEIDLRIEGTSTVGAKDDPVDVVPPVEALPITQPGDVWLLGRHRLYCGNALEESSFQRLMNGMTAAMVFVDPPYNVPVDGHISGLGAVKHREFAMAAGEMDAASFTDFLSRACQLLAQHSSAGSIHYVCMDWRHMGELLAAGAAAYTELKNLCVWAKDNAGMGTFYRSQHELVFVFKHGTEAYRNNFELGQYGRYRSNIWNYAGANSFSRKTEEGNVLAMHPTVKPVAMVADAMLDCSARNDVVLDSFLGSGTTLMAAERVGRICYGMELDPLYIDTAIRRWQTYTGAHAMHETAGRSFNDTAASIGGTNDRH